LFSETHGQCALAGEWVSEGVEEVGQLGGQGGGEGVQEWGEEQAGDATVELLIESTVKLFGELHPEGSIDDGVHEACEVLFLKRKIVCVVDGDGTLEGVLFEKSKGIEDICSLARFKFR
jgi:hypothetical protein